LADKQKQIAEVQDKIKWIKENLSGKTPINEIFASKSPKRDLLLKWAEYLEDLAKYGAYTKPISTISTTITEDLKEMGLNESIPYVRVALPFKYKDVSKMHSEDDDDSRVTDSRENSSATAKENKPFTSRLRKTARLLEIAANKIERKSFIKNLDKKELKALEELYHLWDNALVQLNDALDSREKVINSKQFLFFYAFSKAGLNAVYSYYVRFVKEFAKLTGKQAGKLMEGRVKRLLPMYEPKNRLEAMDDGYYGFPCAWCNSFRVKMKWDTDRKAHRLLCFACGEWSDPKTELLPDK